MRFIPKLSDNQLKNEIKLLVKQERKRQILSYHLKQLGFQDFSAFLLPVRMSNN